MIPKGLILIHLAFTINPSPNPTVTDPEISDSDPMVYEPNHKHGTPDPAYHVTNLLRTASYFMLIFINVHLVHLTYCFIIDNNALPPHRGHVISYPLHHQVL